MGKRANQPGGWGPDAARGMGEASRGLALAAGFVLPVILLWLAGRAVDGWLNTEPWAQLLGTVVGWTVGFFYVFYASQRSE